MIVTWKTCNARSEKTDTQLAFLQLQEKPAKQRIHGLFALFIWLWQNYFAPKLLADTLYCTESGGGGALLDLRIPCLDFTVCTYLQSVECKEPAVISFMLHSEHGCRTLAANTSGLQLDFNNFHTTSIFGFLDVNESSINAPMDQLSNFENIV